MQDKPADAYYGEPEEYDEELDLSFLDEDDKGSDQDEP